MKNIFLFFFLFIILNAAVAEKNDFTKEKIDEIVKNIKNISDSIDCDSDTLEQELEIFGLEEYKKNDLYSQLINACNSSNNEDKELFIRTMYEFFKKLIIGNKGRKFLLQQSSESSTDNGLGTYLCQQIMIILGYDSSDC